MKVFLTSLLVASLALAVFANVVPSKNATLESAANLTSTHNATAVDMGEALADLFNAYKNVMPCGNATYGLPPMAPYRMPSVKVNFTGEHLAFKGDIENLVIAGLDDYLIIQLTTNASINRTEMDILHKNIQILGKFNIKIEAEYAGFKQAHPFEGFINVELMNLRVTSGLDIGINEVGGIKLSNVEYSLQIGDIIVNNLNTKWSVAVNNFVNQYIRDFTMLMLQTNREGFGKVYSEYVTQMANKALYNIPYSYVGSSISEAIQLFKSMDCNQ